jgi:phosphoglycerol transferase MdoB-like AlkP superfamily enzyme
MRTFFLAANIGYLNTKTNLLQAYTTGMRFDLAAWFYITGLLYLYWSLPCNTSSVFRYRKPYTWFLIVSAGAILFFNGIDIGYYPFSEKRITYELFVLKGDIRSFSPSVLLDFTWIFAVYLFIMIVYAFAMLRLLPRMIESLNNKILVPAESRLFRNHSFLILPVMIIAFTGILRGYGERPLRPAMAFADSDRFTGHLASNTAYNILFTTLERKPEAVHLIDPASAREFISSSIKNDFDKRIVHPDYPFHREASFREAAHKKNVILIVMESFNGKDTGILNGIPQSESLTPGFDTLAAKGLLFTHYYANARRSIEAFPALLDSMPDILGFPIISTNVETNHFTNLADILKNQGYRTLFFHGGRNGSMGLDNYSHIAGFENYFGKTEYEKVRGNKDFDGHWGIYDQKFFDYTLDEIKTASADKKPFFAVIFSLSNHHPFSLPDDYNKPDQNSLTAPQKTLRYADEALYNFIKKAEHDPAFKDTVFLVTADHNTFEGLNINRSIMDVFRVPFLIYSPGFVSPGSLGVPGGHTDLLPTVIDLLKISTEYAATGRSLLGSNDKKTVILHDNGIYAFILENHILISSFMGLENYLVRKNDKWEAVKNSAVDKSTKEFLQSGFKSFYQEIFNSLIQNEIMAPAVKTR